MEEKNIESSGVVVIVDKELGKYSYDFQKIKYVLKDTLGVKDIISGLSSSPFLSSVAKNIIPKSICASAVQRLWNKGYKGSGVRVAVLDEGVDRSHPDLRGRVISSINLTGEVGAGNHATHVAGTIAANGILKGLAPSSSIIDVKVLGRYGGSFDSVSKGIRMAVNMGANIINMSLGGTSISSTSRRLLQDSINYAYNKGCLCFAAAGNDGVSSGGTVDVLEYPASLDLVEGVLVRFMILSHRSL